MTDTTETLPPAPVDDVRARNKAILFAALAATGIRRVTVDYDGSGDSGNIQTIQASDSRAQEMPLPTEPKVQLLPNSPDPPHAESTLDEAISNLAWDYLEERHAGWEIDDGAYGTFVFDVPARTITLEHYERFTDVTTSTDEF